MIQTQAPPVNPAIITCPACEGDGFHVDQVWFSRTESQGSAYECYVCSGVGTVTIPDALIVVRSDESERWARLADQSRGYGLKTEELYAGVWSVESLRGRTNHMLPPFHTLYVVETPTLAISCSCPAKDICHHRASVADALERLPEMPETAIHHFVCQQCGSVHTTQGRALACCHGRAILAAAGGRR